MHEEQTVMYIFKALFFFVCFDGLSVETAQPQVNKTREHGSNGNKTEPLKNTDNSTLQDDNKNITSTKPAITNGLGYNNSNENKIEPPKVNVSTLDNAICEDANSGFPTLVQANLSQFFSKDFALRLELWIKSLSNVSKHCSKLKKSVEKYIGVDFPVFKATMDRESEFLSFATINPVLVRDKSEKDLVKIAYLAILELWPLLLLCFSCAALSGMIVWVLDSRANSEQFSKRFWRGIFDGIWWAVVTMATVGYGDKSPKSFFARLFATVWMVTGIILLSMFTAQVSSRLTTQELKGDDHLLHKRIGVPRALYGSDYVHDTMALSTVEALDEPLETIGKLDEMELNSVLVFHCDDKTSDNNGWEVLQFMASLHVGAELYYRPRDDEIVEFDIEDKYIKCMKRRINAKCRKRDPEGSSGRSSPHSSCDKLVKEHDKLKFEFKWVYFKDLSQYLIPFGTMVGLIILFFIVGSIWDCCHHKEKNKFQDSETDPEAFQSGLVLHKSLKEKEPMLNNDLLTQC